MIAIALEQRRGALLYHLCTHLNWIDLYPLNPHSLDSSRQTLFSNRAKDTRRLGGACGNSVPKSVNAIRSEVDPPAFERLFTSFSAINFGLLQALV